MLFSPKRIFRNTDLDSVRVSAFGHKQSFRFYAYACILTVNECLLSAKSGHSASSQNSDSDGFSVLLNHQISTAAYRAGSLSK